MIINCTKKLLDKINEKPVDVSDYNELNSYHANIITFNRKNVLVIMNDLTQYAIVFYGLKKKEFDKLGEVIKEGVKSLLLFEGINERIVNDLIKDEIVFSKSKGRSYLGSLNMICKDVQFFDEYIYENDIIQIQLSKLMNRRIRSSKKEGMYFADEHLYKVLDEQYDSPIFKCNTLTLEFNIKTEKYNIVRIVDIPANTSFEKLHNKLQKFYGFNNSHLHHFEVKTKEDSYDVINYRMIDEHYSDNAILLEHETVIGDYLNKEREMTYYYDYGDDWQITCKVKKSFISDNNEIKCILSEGLNPVDDIGGIEGYDRFIDIYNDPSHEEYDELMDWLKMMR